MQVLKITTNELPDYPLFVAFAKDYVTALETILTDHPIFDSNTPLGVGAILEIKIEVIEMTPDEHQNLEEWEP